MFTIKKELEKRTYPELFLAVVELTIFHSPAVTDYILYQLAGSKDQNVRDKLRFLRVFILN